MKNKFTTIFTLVIVFCVCFIGINAQESKFPPSKVPQYSFSNDLDTQLKELENNPLLQRFNKSREKLSDDKFRPIYHYVNPEGNLNDPNGLCYWKGRWHMFYQAYPPEDSRQHWGHAVSTDLIHWKDLPLAIYPGPEDKCFSGSVLIEEDRAIAAYHGVGAGTMIAISSDPLLLNWEKVTGSAVIPQAKPGQKLPYAVFDPFIWKEGEYYYLLTGGRDYDTPTGRFFRAEYLHRSKNLKSWEYVHPFLENDRFSLVEDDGACPYFWPIGEDKHIMLHYSHISGGKYVLGNYDIKRNKFVVTDGGDFNFGASNPGGIHAPSACPDGKGNVVAIFNMNPAIPNRGWDQIMSLPRLLSIKNGKLYQQPTKSVESLRLNKVETGTMVLPANKEIVLENIKGNAMELVAEIDISGASVFELNVLQSPDKEEYTRISFYKNRGFRDNRKYAGWSDQKKLKNAHESLIVLDNSNSSIAPGFQARPPEIAPILLDDEENLKLRVFIDKSVVEVFVNGKQCVAARVYPSKSSSIGV